jgi:hypothetical protein
MIKEQQKQHIIDIMKQDEELGLYEQTKCYCGHTTTCDCGPEQETNLNKHQNSLAEYPGPRRSAIVSRQEILLEDIFNEEKKQGVKELIDAHKQETLEEAADKWVFETNGHKWSNNNNEAGDNFGSFIAGFKEAEKTLYSEEEVLNLLIEYSKWQLPQTDEDLSRIKQWFNKFKKK